MLEASNSVETGNYKGYLVRIWRSSTQSPWRASARDTRTGEQHHFAQLEKLFLFLGEDPTDQQDPQKPAN